MAIQLAQHYPLEIISVDSALVYKNMDIGTAKPSSEELAQVPHHLINIIDPTMAYSAAEFCQDVQKCIRDIRTRGKMPLLVGGTMLYVQALEQGLSNLPPADQSIRTQLDNEAERDGWPALHYRLAQIDPETASRLATHDAQRIQRALEVWLLTNQPMSVLLTKKDHLSTVKLNKIALVPHNRLWLHQRIAQRFEQMLEIGLINEVKELREKYPTLNPDVPSMRCVGYRQVWQYLEGAINTSQLYEQGTAATRQLAKRQLTWLRSMNNLSVLDCQQDGLLQALLSKI